MEEDDPNYRYVPIDAHTADEFLAQNQALGALIKDAVENNDAYRLNLYREAQVSLAAANPSGGRKELPTKDEVAKLDYTDIYNASTMESLPQVAEEGQLDKRGRAIAASVLGFCVSYEAGAATLTVYGIAAQETEAVVVGMGSGIVGLFMCLPFGMVSAMELYEDYKSRGSN